MHYDVEYEGGYPTYAPQYTPVPGGTDTVWKNILK